MNYSSLTYDLTQTLANNHLIFTHFNRSLMPGRAAEADQDDHSLNQSFRADKIEFIFVARTATPAERTRKQHITDVNLAN